MHPFNTIIKCCNVVLFYASDLKMFSLLGNGTRLSNIHKRIGSRVACVRDFLLSIAGRSYSHYCIVYICPVAEIYPNKPNKMIVIPSKTAQPHFLFHWPTDRYIPRFLPNDLERAQFCANTMKSRLKFHFLLLS